MLKRICLGLIGLSLLAHTAIAQSPKRKPNINESKEYRGVYHSPSAESTPRVFRSVMQLELVVKDKEGEPSVRYANGVVVTKDGVMVSVMDAPGENTDPNGGIESATILTLDGGAANAELIKFFPEYGMAVLRAKKGLDLPALKLSASPIVAKRRLSWHAVFKDGRKTFLYSRPLQIHKAKHVVGKAEDLCEIIDPGSSSLNADRSGSALLSLDGSLLAVMGRQAHWNVTPKNMKPRLKLAWAVPANVIQRILSEQ